MKAAAELAAAGWGFEDLELAKPHDLNAQLDCGFTPGAQAVRNTRPNSS